MLMDTAAIYERLPDALELTQFVELFVIATPYVPATVAEKLATFPGLVSPLGTVQAYEYVFASPGVAVTAVDVPWQVDGLFTVTVGIGFITTLTV